MVWKEDRMAYDQFCASHRASLPLFFQADWIDTVVLQGHWRAWVAFEADKAVALFVGHYRRKYGLSALLMPRLTPYFGFWVPPGETRDQKMLTDTLLMQLPRVFLTSLCLHPSQSDISVWKAKGFHHRLRTTYLIENKNVSAYENGRSAKLQNHLKHAMVRLQIKVTQDASELIALVRESFAKQNLPLPYPETLVHRILNNTSVRARITLAVDDQGEAHAGLLTVEDEKTVYNLISGRKKEAVRGAQALLLDGAIREAITHHKDFDFEGSSIPEIASFFASFGGEMISFYHLHKSAYRWTDRLLQLSGKYKAE